jgi:hypothetical protein
MLVVLMAMAVPAIGDVRQGMKLGQSMRTVERELQAARLESVTANRPIRVRFNCPAAGQLRRVELIGTTSAPTAADNAAASVRCSDTTYPYPVPDLNPLTLPNHDGPVQRLESTVSFGTVATLEFWPDGSVHKAGSGSEQPWPVVSTAGTSITITQTMNGVTQTRAISVNGLGKIQIQR